MYRRTDIDEEEQEQELEQDRELARELDERGAAFARAYTRRDHREHAAKRAPDGAGLDGRALGLGMLVGAALGAGLALLLAPASGEDTLRQLRRGARRLYVRGSDAVADLRDDAERRARRLARRGMERGRDLAQDVRDRARV